MKKNWKLWVGVGVWICAAFSEWHFTLLFLIGLLFVIPGIARVSSVPTKAEEE